jgi:hypothetical protein
MDKNLNNAGFDDILRILKPSCDDIVKDEDENVASVYLYGHEPNGGCQIAFIKFSFDWDLSKKTLSEQSEYVRVQIHHYFQNNNLYKHL